MKHITLFVCVACLSVGAVWAQQPTQTQPTPPPTRQQYEKAIEQLDAQIKLYESKLEASTQVILELDAAIERRIDQIVNHLKTLQDSQDSGTRVSTVKEEVIQNLYNYIQFVVRERDMRRARLEGQPGTTLPRYGLEKEIEFLSERIDKRANQVIALVNSFGGRTDVQRYEYRQDNDDDYGDRWRYGETYHGRTIHYSSGGTVTGKQTTDEYRQMRAVAQRGEMTKERAINNLKQAIDAIKRRNTQLEQRQRYARNMAEMNYLKDQISKNREEITRRQEQLYQLQTTAQAGTQQLARQQAIMIEEQTREEVSDLKMDFRTMLMKRPERQQIKAQIEQLMYRRAQYAAALQKMSVPATPE